MGGIYTIAIVVKIKHIFLFLRVHTQALNVSLDISGLQYPASLLHTLCCHQSNDLLSIGRFILHNLSLRVITGQI